MGVATITAYVNKADPVEVTLDDLQEVSSDLARFYSVNPMRSFLTVLFPNSGYVQPAFDRLPEKRKVYTDLLLTSYRPDAAQLDRPCVFCARPAVMLAFRQHIPLLCGESVFNFYPEGGLGLPVCGACILAIQAFPLGATNCNGRALIAHSDQPAFTLLIARDFLSKNRPQLQLATQDKLIKHSFPKTLLIRTMLKVQRDRSMVEQESYRPPAVTAYHLTNYGTNADVDIYQLPGLVVSFIRKAEQSDYQAAWQGIVHRAEAVAKAKAGNEQPDEQRNYLYDDLFTLPQGARQFLHRYFLRRPLRGVGKPFADDPRTTYSLGRDSDLLSWPLTTLFLREVMNMEQARINTIRDLADRLAEHPDAGSRLVKTIHRARSYPNLRLVLLNLNNETAQRKQPPLFTLDSFLTIFEESEEVAYRDWSLARDLILVRMIEQLYAQKRLDDEAMADILKDDSRQLAEIDKENLGMAFITGLMLIDAPASALNNSGDDIPGARADNSVATKYIQTLGGRYPYVSAQAYRAWLRATLAGVEGWASSPTYREDKVAYSDGNPILYADDDLFGYMRAESKKQAAVDKRTADTNRQSATPTSETVTRLAPFRVSTLVSVGPVNITSDFGVMSRQEGNPVPYEHQFYRTTLQGMFSLDLHDAGTFTYRNRTGYRNLDDNRRDLAEGRGLEHIVAEKAYRLPLAERQRRVQLLLEGMSRIEGGAKLTLHYTDVTPVLLLVAVTKGGNNIFGHVVKAVKDVPRLNSEALAEVLRVYRDDLLSPVYVGWVRGYLDDERALFDRELAEGGSLAEYRDLFTIAHPREALQALATQVGDNPAWLE